MKIADIETVFLTEESHEWDEWDDLKDEQSKHLEEALRGLKESI